MKETTMTLTDLMKTKPEFLNHASPELIRELDVRPILMGGQDPFSRIMSEIDNLKEGEVLKIVNSFEPLPLYKVLGRLGFDHFTEQFGNEYHIYFWKTVADSKEVKDNSAQKEKADTTVVIELDVRELEPPEPMIKILEKLTQLPECAVLLVHHHREPVMLYPKLEENGFEATANKINENYYKVLISRIK